MEIQKDKSVLSQKCKCGEPIDYFKLRGHAKKEKYKNTIMWMKIVGAMLIVGTILLTFLIFHYKSTWDAEDLFGRGIWYGMLYGFMFAFAYVVCIMVRADKKYNPERARKGWTRWKRRWGYYHSLSKRKKRMLAWGYVKSIGVTILPFIVLVITGLLITEYMLKEGYDKFIALLPSIIALTLYLIFWKYSKGWIKYNTNRNIKYLSKEGIRYQKFNKGEK